MAWAKMQTLWAKMQILWAKMQTLWPADPMGEDADAAREPPYVIRSSRNEGLIPVKPKLGDPRHPIAEWATIVTAKGREAIDGNFYTYHEFCRYYGARRCWDGTPRAYEEWRRAYHVMDHGMLNDRRREALHDFLLRVLQARRDFGKYRKMLTNDRFTAVFDDNIMKAIGSFIEEDETMVDVMTSLAPVVYSRSDPVFSFAIY